MTLRFALSKVLEILPRLWGSTRQSRRRGMSVASGSRAKIQRIYTRNGVGVSYPQGTIEITGEIRSACRGRQQGEESWSILIHPTNQRRR